MHVLVHMFGFVEELLFLSGFKIDKAYKITEFKRYVHVNHLQIVKVEVAIEVNIMADEKGILTDSIVSYDGIFKGMYDETLRNMYQEGRKLLAEGKHKEGKQLFVKALEQSHGHPMDNKTLKLIISELDRLDKYSIDGGIQAVDAIEWESVVERDLERLDESLFGLPQSVFFLHIGKPGLGSVRLVGRKLLSDMWVQFKIPEIHCSFITANMILGVFADQRLTDSNITVYYHPLSNAEKLKAMEDIMTKHYMDTEIISPFPLMSESTRQEWGSPPEGWIVDDAYDMMLGCGEERLRAYSIQFLKDAGLEKPLLYDPACSTGVFLSTLQKALPGSYTFGQDLSQQMANFAKERIDEAHCANAATPKIKAGTADAVYIRFLNSEVIKTSEAEMLLDALLPTVKHGGFIITFGHTPVLLSSSNFRRLKDFNLRQCIGVAEDRTGIFQYYVIQRK